MLRKARKDRARDVRKGVQSSRTRDWEIGRAEEDTIGGTFFLRGSLFPFCCLGDFDASREVDLFVLIRERGCRAKAKAKGLPVVSFEKRKRRLGFLSLFSLFSRSLALLFLKRKQNLSSCMMRGERRLQFLKIFAFFSYFCFYYITLTRILSLLNQQMEEEGVPSTALREVSLLQMLSESAFIVRLLKVEHVEEDGKAMLYLVFEYLNQDLKHFMDETGRGPANPLPKSTVQNFMYQLLLGTAHLHKHGVMHRDLKPQNLLVDKAQNVLKIADLGLGRAFSVPVKSYTHEIVTLWYRAPEVLLGGSHYSTPVDIWSVGCIFAEMARKQPLFPGDSELQQLLHIFKLLGTPNETVWPGVTKLRDWHEFPQWKAQDLAKIVPQLDKNGIDLLQQMLEFDPAKRIHATEALEHPYFADLEKTQFAKIEEQFEKENRVSVNAQ